jgi:hypothetical protein
VREIPPVVEEGTATNLASAIGRCTETETQMSSDESNDKTETTTTEQANTQSGPRSRIMAPTGRGGDVATRNSDFAAKPGFRSASNKRSKATKKRRKK